MLTKQHFRNGIKPAEIATKLKIGRASVYRILQE
jgi:DNA invertase Pin-like site-specific DNA recombinase